MKKVDPVRWGPIQCLCCYEYSMKTIDLARVKDAEVLSIAAPCPQRVCCCANGLDFVEVHPTDSAYGRLVMKLNEGEGEKVCKMILTQVEKNHLMERE